MNHEIWHHKPERLLLLRQRGLEGTRVVLLHGRCHLSLGSVGILSLRYLIPGTSTIMRATPPKRNAAFRPAPAAICCSTPVAWHDQPDIARQIRGPPAPASTAAPCTWCGEQSRLETVSSASQWHEDSLISGGLASKQVRLSGAARAASNRVLPRCRDRPLSIQSRPCRSRGTRTSLPATKISFPPMH